MSAVPIRMSTPYFYSINSRLMGPNRLRCVCRNHANGTEMKKVVKDTNGDCDPLGVAVERRAELST